MPVVHQTMVKQHIHNEWPSTVPDITSAVWLPYPQMVSLNQMAWFNYIRNLNVDYRMDTVCARACVRACVRACMHACMYVCMCVRASACVRSTCGCLVHSDWRCWAVSLHRLTVTSVVTLGGHRRHTMLSTSGL